MNLRLKSDYKHLTPNYPEIHKDIEYFLMQSQEASVREIKNRFARVSIVFTAFYVESLASLLAQKVATVYNIAEDFEKCVRKDNWPTPLRILFGAYLVFQNKPLSTREKKDWSLDTDVIRDLFLIRNQVFAHPQAYSTVSGTDVVAGKGLTQKGKSLALKKYKSFPNIYRGFTYGNAKEIYDATRLFLESYGNLIKTYPIGKDFASMFK